MGCADVDVAPDAMELHAVSAANGEGGGLCVFCPHRARLQADASEEQPPFICGILGTLVLTSKRSLVRPTIMGKNTLVDSFLGWSYVPPRTCKGSDCKGSRISVKPELVPVLFVAMATSSCDLYI